MYIYKERIVSNGDVDFKCTSGTQTLINGETSLRNIYYDIRFLNWCTPPHAHKHACVDLVEITKQKAQDLRNYAILPTTVARSKMCSLRHQFITTSKREKVCHFAFSVMCPDFTSHNITDNYIMIILRGFAK